MAHVRKQRRREVALKNYPKSPASRKGKRSEAEWKAERERLIALIHGQR